MTVKCLFSVLDRVLRKLTYGSLCNLILENLHVKERKEIEKPQLVYGIWKEERGKLRIKKY